MLCLLLLFVPGHIEHKRHAQESLYSKLKVFSRLFVHYITQIHHFWPFFCSCLHNRATRPTVPHVFYFILFIVIFLLFCYFYRPCNAMVKLGNIYLLTRQYVKRKKQSEKRRYGITPSNNKAVRLSSWLKI